MRPNMCDKSKRGRFRGVKENYTTDRATRDIIVQWLDSTSPIGARESLLLAAIANPALTPSILRHVLIDLAQDGLISLSKRASADWHAQLVPGYGLAIAVSRSLMH